MTFEKLLPILCCPETHQSLREADAALLARVNDLIKSGQLRNRIGRTVEQPLDGGFVREDGKVMYPIHGTIPVMLIDEGIEIPGVPK